MKEEVIRQDALPCAQHGVFRCDDCGAEWVEEIPGLEAIWPSCCGIVASLLYPLLQVMTALASVYFLANGAI